MIDPAVLTDVILAGGRAMSSSMCVVEWQYKFASNV